MRQNRRTKEEIGEIANIVELIVQLGQDFKESCFLFFFFSFFPVLLLFSSFRLLQLSFSLNKPSKTKLTLHVIWVKELNILFIFSFISVSKRNGIRGLSDPILMAPLTKYGWLSSLRWKTYSILINNTVLAWRFNVVSAKRR